MNRGGRSPDAPFVVALKGYDRVVIRGTLSGICYPAGMASYLTAHGIRLFDYARFAEPLRDANAERLAGEHGIELEFVRSPDAFSLEPHRPIEVIVRGLTVALLTLVAAVGSCGSTISKFEHAGDEDGGDSDRRPLEQWGQGSRVSVVGSIGLTALQSLAGDVYPEMGDIGGDGTPAVGMSEGDEQSRT